jgi:membrane-bound serine protease (ClpP class)
MTALGLSLLVVGAILILIETHLPSLGFLGGPGVIAIGAGTLLAIGGLGGGLALALIVAVLLSIAGLGMLGLTVSTGLAVRRRRVRAGPERLIGQMGTVRGWSDGTGNVVVDGAIWQARRSATADDDDELPLHTGDPIVVERLDGLTLAVRPAEHWELIR